VSALTPARDELQAARASRFGHVVLGAALMAEGLGFGVFVVWMVMRATSAWSHLVSTYPDLTGYSSIYTGELIERTLVMGAMLSIVIAAGVVSVKRGSSWRGLGVAGRLLLIAAGMLNIVLVVGCLLALILDRTAEVRLSVTFAAVVGIAVLAELVHVARASRVS
jgi:hypothetical protein